MQRSSKLSVALLLSLASCRVLLVFGGPNGSEPAVTFGAKRANYTQCYSTSVKANIFSLLPITRIVTFTPKMHVRYITVASKTSGKLTARIVQGGVNMDTLRPISVALTSDYGGRLYAEVNAYCGN
ncbi:uncharacterized protein LOC128302893 [Anopheles moucheti]|uniref:uncharacterized protein LOC128302893 n=1 Tax=Anopheles moucheti TaxID=186751 RepID=UPI0022F076C5|nr:uncharacterized protein LOC128302893 [Anopheles moucheti]